MRKRRWWRSLALLAVVSLTGCQSLRAENPTDKEVDLDYFISYFRQPGKRLFCQAYSFSSSGKNFEESMPGFYDDGLDIVSTIGTMGMTESHEVVVTSPSAYTPFGCPFSSVYFGEKSGHEWYYFLWVRSDFGVNYIQYGVGAMEGGSSLRYDFSLAAGKWLMNVFLDQYNLHCPTEKQVPWRYH